MARSTVHSPQLWGDIETTCIDPEEGHILEIGWMVRGTYGPDSPMKSRLVIPDFVRLTQTDEPIAAFRFMYDNLDPYVQKMHSENGLKAALEEIISTGDIALMKSLSLEAAVDEIYNDLLTVEAGIVADPAYSAFEKSTAFEKKNQSILLCGNSVHFDKKWLLHHVPKEHPLWWVLNISHQVLDLSGIGKMWNIAEKNWDENGKSTYPDVPVMQELSEHRAQYDIARAYETYKFYCKNGISPAQQ